MQVGTGKSILNGIAIGKLKIYKKKDTVISAAEVADIGQRSLELQEVIEPPARSGGVKLNSVDELIDVLKNTAKVL